MYNGERVPSILHLWEMKLSAPSGDFCPFPYVAAQSCHSRGDSLLKFGLEKELSSFFSLLERNKSFMS